jgi:hypothetical protein
MLNGQKDVELRPWRKGDPERSDKYTHVLLRMVRRLRKMMRLKHLNLMNVNLVARLGEKTRSLRQCKGSDQRSRSQRMEDWNG